MQVSQSALLQTVVLPQEQLNSIVGTFPEKLLKERLQSKVVGSAGVASAKNAPNREAKKNGLGLSGGSLGEGRQKFGKSLPHRRFLGEGQNQ